MGWILGAGGIAVLAHPGRYGLKPAVASGVVQPGREQGHAGATAAVLLQQRLQGPGAQQGDVAVQHQNSPMKPCRGSSSCCTAWPVPFWGCCSTNSRPCSAARDASTRSAW